MPPSDVRKRLEDAGATGELLDLLTVPRADHAAELSAFERWACDYVRGETEEEAKARRARMREVYGV